MPRCMMQVHNALKTLLCLVPTGSARLLEILVAQYPHKRHDASTQQEFLRHALCVADYAPTLRDRILGTVVDRLIEIDVCVCMHACLHARAAEAAAALVAAH